MNKITKKLAVIIVLAAAVLLPCSFAQVTDPTVASVLEKMPTANRQQEQLLLTDLINPGTSLLMQICDLIVPPGTGDDTKARYALSSLSFYISRSRNIEMRPVYTGSLARALRNATDDEVKAFFITQFQLVGTIEYVSDLSKYLDNDRLCEQAAMAMLSISKKHAESEFMSALGTVSQKNLPTIIHALGQIQSKRAVSEISKYAASDDVLIRQVSLKALGNIGDESSIKILEKASKIEDPYEKALATSAYLQLAKRLSETGETGKSVKICRNLLKGEYPASQSNVPSAALSILTDALGDKAIGYLLDAVDSENLQVQAAALALADKICGTKATAKWIKKLKKVSPARQTLIIEMLGSRNDKTALAALRDVSTNADKQVKLTALKAIVQLDGDGALDDLMNSLKTADDDQIEEYKSILMQLSADQVTEAIIKSLPQVPAKVQVALMEILAHRRVKQLPAAMKVASTDQKISIIKQLPAIGGKQAFEIVLAETKSTDPQIQDAAIRSLAGWKDAEAIDSLFEIAAGTKESSHHVMALKGYANLVAKGDISAATKVAYFEKAMKVARRPEEKKIIISRLSQCMVVESLEMAVGLLDDKALAVDATRAVVKIALPNAKGYKGLKGPGVGGLLLDAYSGIADDEIRKKIDMHIKTLAKEGVGLDLVSQKQTPEGFVSLFNGKDLTGWKGLLAGPYDNPAKRAKLGNEEYAARQAEADTLMRKHWHVVDGVLYFDGGGFSLATIREYGDFVMLVDWKLMGDKGDSGIYLRGSPQVQIWDTAQHKTGSGGLYNNKKNPSKPTVIADNPIGQWNTFRILMKGDKVTVFLNDILVVESVTLENYWDRSLPIFPREQIELQCHGDPICFRNIFIREIPRPGEFVSLFNGRDLTGWVGDTAGYVVEDGKIVCKPGGNLYTEKQYSDFVLRFDFMLTDGANNGLGIRTRPGVNAAYDGMEIQILDNTAEKYKDKIKEYQYHGSIYGVVPAKRGFLKPVGQWNSEEVIAKGNQITVILNGETIVDADIKEASKNGTVDNRPHPGLFNKAGHIGFLGHGSVVEFRNISIKTIDIEE